MDYLEYKVIKISTSTTFLGMGLDINEKAFEKKINNLSAQGWELISTEAIAGEYGPTKFLVAIFKRQKN